jgi:hypothetical protein
MKTSVSGLNALFWGTKVGKHPFFSIGPKMMFGIVSKHFGNLLHVKNAKLVFFGLECTISEYQSSEASILLHGIQKDVWD